MAAALRLVVTAAGYAALRNAAGDGTNEVRVATVGLTDKAFTPGDPLPTEIKRVATIKGGATAADTIHVTISDDDADVYSVRGFALYLTDGTRFASYGQPSVIVEKSGQAAMLIAFDVKFDDIDATQITFGDTNFSNPAATTERLGIVELATDDETLTGADSQRVVTPRGLRRLLDFRFGDGAPSAFVKSLLTKLSASEFAKALGIRGAASYDTGHGNGLDADKLDGKEGEFYAPRDAAHLSNVSVIGAGAGGGLTLRDSTDAKSLYYWTWDADGVALCSMDDKGVFKQVLARWDRTVSTSTFGGSNIANAYIYEEDATHTVVRVGRTKDAMGYLRLGADGVVSMNGTNLVNEVRKVTAGPGLNGGGALSKDLTFSVVFGAGGIQDIAARTDDPRLSDARKPTDHSHPIANVIGLSDALQGLSDKIGTKVGTGSDGQLNSLTLGTSGSIYPDANGSLTIRIGNGSAGFHYLNLAMDGALRKDGVAMATEPVVATKVARSNGSVFGAQFVFRDGTDSVGRFYNAWDNFYWSINCLDDRGSFLAQALRVYRPDGSVLLPATLTVGSGIVVSAGGMSVTGGVFASGGFYTNNGVPAVMQSDFTSSRGDTGWLRHPDGMIEQWGTYYPDRTWSEGTGPTIAFPRVFPSACLNVQLTDLCDNAVGWNHVDCYSQLTSRSTAGFTTFVQMPGGGENFWRGMSWRAIGY